MRLLYEAQNSIEAYMILNLIEQAGLRGRIDGEYLQGGVGELQAIGLVRVMVEESDYEQAKNIIDEWERNQPKEEQQAAAKKPNSFAAAIIAFLLGITTMFVYYRTPVTHDGIDYNGDGKIDEKWMYINNRIAKTEIDRNHDGQTDLIYSFNHKGIIESSSSDNDFNGSFETDVYFEHGNPYLQKSDSNGDGFKNYIVSFSNGILATARFIDPVSKKTIKVQEFGPHTLKRAEADTNGDGLIDTVYEYDDTESVLSITKTSKE